MFLELFQAPQRLTVAILSLSCPKIAGRGHNSWTATLFTELRYPACRLVYKADCIHKNAFRSGGSQAERGLPGLEDDKGKSDNERGTGKRQ